jgi:hypothetical protein
VFGEGLERHHQQEEARVPGLRNPRGWRSGLESHYPSAMSVCISQREKSPQVILPQGKKKKKKDKMEKKKKQAEYLPQEEDKKKRRRRKGRTERARNTLLSRSFYLGNDGSFRSVCASQPWSCLFFCLGSVLFLFFFIFFPSFMC